MDLLVSTACCRMVTILLIWHQNVIQWKERNPKVTPARWYLQIKWFMTLTEPVNELWLCGGTRAAGGSRSTKKTGRTGDSDILCRYKVLSIFHFRKRNQIKVAFCPEWLYPRCVVTGDSNHCLAAFCSQPANILENSMYERMWTGQPSPHNYCHCLPSSYAYPYSERQRTNMIVGWIRIFANSYRAYSERYAWFPFGNTELCRRRRSRVGVKNENFKEIEIWKYNAAMAVEYVIRIVRHHITIILFIYTYEGIWSCPPTNPTSQQQASNSMLRRCCCWLPHPAEYVHWNA